MRVDRKEIFMVNDDEYYVNVKWLTLVIPVLGIGIYEFVRVFFLDKYLSPLVNGFLLMIAVGLFGKYFSMWLFKQITIINSSLFREQHRLQAFFDYTSDGIVVVDEKGNILDINPSAEKLTGWNKKEVIGKLTCDQMNKCSHNKETCWNSDYSDSCMNVDCGHRECWGKTAISKMTSIPNVEMCIRKKNGQKLKVAASYSYIPPLGEEKRQVEIVLRDISERKELELAIQNYATLQERYRLAREMHDGLAQTMVYINFKARDLQQSLENINCSEPLLYEIGELSQTIQEAVNEVRGNIFDLKIPPRNERSCFRIWIEDYLKHFGSLNHIEIDFVCNCDHVLILPTDVKVQLIRIIQEAMTNIKKHASATKTILTLDKSPQKLIITIADNGRGINGNILFKDDRHFGLAIMRERAQIIGGSLKICPNHPRGTLVEITLPILGRSGLAIAERRELSAEVQGALS